MLAACLFSQTSPTMLAHIPLPLSTLKKEPAIAEDLLLALKEMSAQQKEVLAINLIENELVNYIQKVVKVDLC